MAFFDMFISDGFARFSKMLILLSAAVVLAMSAEYLDRRGMLRFELHPHRARGDGHDGHGPAGDLLTLYLGLELQSLSLYVVAAMRRDSVKSSRPG